MLVCMCVGVCDACILHVAHVCSNNERGTGGGERKKHKSLHMRKQTACLSPLPSSPPPPLLLRLSHCLFSLSLFLILSLAVVVSVFHCVCQHSLGLIFRLQHKLKLTEETQAKAVASTERGTEEME